MTPTSNTKNDPEKPDGAAEVINTKAVRTFLETTSVKGVPKMVKSASKVLRILWFIALLFGLGVAAYFLTKLFINYFSYGAVLYLTHEPVQATDFPDVTLCNLNPFANTPVGADGINGLIHTVENVYNPALTSALGYPVDIFAIPEFQDVLRPGKLLEFLTGSLLGALPEHGWDTTHNFLVYCEWGADGGDPGYDCMENAQIRLYNTDYGYCFTFTQPPNVTAVHGFSAILYLDAFSFVTSMPAFPVGLGNVFTNGARVILHPRGSLPLLHEGLNIEAGDHTTVSVAINRLRKKGDPYSVCDEEPMVDQCWTGVDLGPNIQYRKEACENFCFQRKILDDCDCITGTLLSMYPMRENQSFCGEPRSENVMDIVSDVQSALDCFNSVPPTTCPVPCQQDTYDLTLFRSDWPHSAYQLAFYDEHILGKPYADDFSVYANISQILAEGNLNGAFDQLEASNLIRRNFLQVNVVWKEYEITEMTEVPSMEIEGLIGNLGGVLNLWVGISFVTAIEIVEMFINICKCCGRGKARNKRIQVKPKAEDQVRTPVHAWGESYTGDFGTK